jgi:hypothetical protein
MIIEFDQEEVELKDGLFHLLAFDDDREISCYADIAIAALVSQQALACGIKLKSIFSTAKFLQPFFFKRIREDDFDDETKSVITLRMRDIPFRSD